jgi:Amt family ammonium transporter
LSKTFGKLMMLWRLALAWCAWLWGGLAAGIFGQTALGGLGGVSFYAQLIGSALGVVIALLGGYVVYGALKAFMGLKLTEEEEHNGADLTIHHVSATPNKENSWS